jgi:hypothetical protein
LKKIVASGARNWTFPKILRNTPINLNADSSRKVRGGIDHRQGDVAKKPQETAMRGPGSDSDRVAGAGRPPLEYKA